MIKNSETGKRIIKNAAYLAIGSIVGKMAMFVAFIIIARCLGPNEFGVYTTAFNHVFIMGMFAKLGFDMTVIREGAKDISKAELIQNKIFPLRLWVSVFVWLITILSAFLLSYDNETFKLVIIMSPLVLLGGAITSGMLEHYTTYFKIIEKMQYVTYVLVFRTLLFTGSIFALLLFDHLNLISVSILVVLSSLFALIFQVLQAKKFYCQKFILIVDFKFLKIFIKPILMFGIVSILYEVSLRLNILMLNKLGSAEMSGYYSAAWNLVSIGTLFISSFSTSLFPNSARSIFKYSFRSKMFNGLFVGSIIFSFGCIIAIFLSNYVITIIYGDEFATSAFIFNIIIWFLPLRLFSLWGHQILESGNYLSIRVWVFIIPTVVNIILNYLYIPIYGVIGSAYVSLFSNMILLLLSLCAGIYVIKTDKRFKK